MNLTKYKKLTLFLILLIPIGLGTKFYCGRFAFGVNTSLSDVIYEIFWAVLIYLVFPRISIKQNIAGVFVATSILEVLQLVKTPLLTTIRSNFWGKILLGTTFVWSDFFYYAMGCMIGYIILVIHRKSIVKQEASPKKII